MNRKVFVTMLSLCVAFLLGLYIAKIFFPQEFAFAISNENVATIGNVIDSNIVLTWICAMITSFITYWLFLCACKRKYTLNWKEIVVVLIFIVAVRVIRMFDVNLASHISISSFFIIPLVFKHDLKIATITFAIHGLSQVLSLSIRNLPIYFINVNSITAILAGGECILWLVLMYIIFNYKEEIDYGRLVSTLLRKIFFLRKEEGEGSPRDREVQEQD